MISLEAFVEKCGKLLKIGEYFVAYWHTNGFCIMRTGGFEYTEYTIDFEVRGPLGVGLRRAETTCEERKDRLVKYNNGRIVKQQKRTKKPKKSTVTAFQKEVRKMEKNWRTAGSLRTVEFSENGLITKGDGLDALYAIPISGDGNPVGP